MKAGNPNMGLGKLLQHQPGSAEGRRGSMHQQQSQHRPADVHEAHHTDGTWEQHHAADTHGNEQFQQSIGLCQHMV